MFNHLNPNFDRLDPCPFCDCIKIHFGQYRKDGLEILCKGCSISRKQRVLKFDLAWLEKKMVEHWNTRKSPDPEHS